MARVHEEDLQKGKVYHFSNLRQAKGVFEGVDGDGDLIFSPIALGQFSLNKEGFVNFCKDDSDDWLEADETV